MDLRGMSLERKRIKVMELRLQARFLRLKLTALLEELRKEETGLRLLESEEVRGGKDGDGSKEAEANHLEATEEVALADW